MSTMPVGVLRIRKDRDWDEWRVEWNVDGHRVPDWTYHASDREDAEQTLKSEYEWGRKHGYNMNVADKTLATKLGLPK